MAARRTYNGSGSSSNARARAKEVVICSCGRETVVQTVKNGPNTRSTFYGCPSWPDTKCNFLKWTHEDEEEDVLRSREFAKENIIWRLEYEIKLKDAIIKVKDELIKKLELKKDKLVAENQETKLHLSQTRVELTRTSTNARNISMALFFSWILFAFAYFGKA